MTKDEVERLVKKVMAYSGDTCQMCVIDTFWVFCNEFKEEISSLGLTFDELKELLLEERKYFRETQT